MVFSIRVFFYRTFIDPLLSGLHEKVAGYIAKNEKVLDIACGSGTLAFKIALKGGIVTGIDISADNISAADKYSGKKGLGNTRFLVQDASNLSIYSENAFDVALTSMSVHQFDPDLAVKILKQMKRISGKIIIADYNHHMPRRWGRSIAWGIERMAGGEHFRNFKYYMRCGGIHHFAGKANLKIMSERLTGGGIFVISVCE